MADDTKTQIERFLHELDLLTEGGPHTLYLSGGAAVVLGYGGIEQTKDVDAVGTREPFHEILLTKAGRKSKLHSEMNLFFEVVPPIYPWAPGWRDRSIPAEASLEHIQLRLLEVHDLIISKLLRLHAKDRSDIETLTRHETFSPETLVERYRAAREELKFYMADKVEKADKNLNVVLEQILGEKPIEFDEVIY